MFIFSGSNWDGAEEDVDKIVFGIVYDQIADCLRENAFTVYVEKFGHRAVFCLYSPVLEI